MRSIRHLSNLLAATLLVGASIAAALPSGRVAVDATGFGAEGDQMGAAVAVLDDTAIVGSPNATPGLIASAGAVQIFRNGAGGWEREALLQGNTAGSGFGGEVTIGPDVVAVGTSGAVGNTFVYRRSGRTWERSDVFDYGNHPSISGDTLAISNANGVRVWTDETGAWTVQADFGGDLAGQGEFVLAANVSGDTLAFLTYVFTGSTGAAVNGYFYTRSGETWARDAKIAFGVIPKSLFQSGTAIRLSGETALISLAGDASVRVRGDGSWPQQAELADISFPLFPTSIAIQGDRAVVGGGGDDVLGVPEQGSAYVFERSGSTWSRVSHPYDANGGVFQHFGASVALPAIRCSSDRQAASSMAFRRAKRCRSCLMPVRGPRGRASTRATAMPANRWR